MKEPIRFIREDGGDEVLFCCGECGTFCGKEEDYAKYHCGGRPCDECGEPSKQHYTKCEACIAKGRAAKDAERRANAGKVDAEKYDGPVFWDEQDSYYPDVGEAWEAIQDEFGCDIESARQMTLRACDKSYLTLCPSDILDNALDCQEHHDDARDSISDKAYEELSRFCEAWNGAHGAQVESWFPNDRLVVIPEAWWTEYKNEAKEVAEG
jgi:hypothetical protein